MGNPDPSITSSNDNDMLNLTNKLLIDLKYIYQLYDVIKEQRLDGNGF